MKKATVIIPNYNGMKYLPDCIKSLRAQTSRDFDILIVDNASTDGSREWIEKEGLSCINNKENLGFAGGVNVGIKACTTEYVILLNNDTKAFPSYVENLIRAIERSKRIFSVSSMMIKESNHALIDDAGDGLCVLGWGYQRGIDEPISKYERKKEVFTACAGAAIYRRAVFDRIGFFDEKHFAYLEDIDIGYRAKIHGYHNMYEPSARVYHIGSATSGSKYNSFKVKLAARNTIYMLYKNQPNVQLVVNSPFILVGILAKIAFFDKLGFKREYIEGIKEGIKKRHSLKRVDFSEFDSKIFFSIEWELLAGLAAYIKHYLIRRL